MNNYRDLKSMNKMIAVLPFKKEVLSKETSKGLDFTDVSSSSLISSEVVFDSEHYSKNDLVYFRSDITKIAHLNSKFKIGELVFLLIPEDMVFAVQSYCPQKPHNGEYYP